MATDWLMLRDEYLHTEISLTGLARERGVSVSALKTHAAREGWAAQKRTRRSNDGAADRPGPFTRPTPSPAGGAEPRARPATPKKRAAAKSAAKRAGRAGASPSERRRATETQRKPSVPGETGDPMNPTIRRTPARRENPDGADAAANRLARLAAIGDQLTDQLARAAGELDKQVVLVKTRTREMVYEDAEGRGKPVEETVKDDVELTIVDALVNCSGLQKLSATLKNLRDATRADAGNGESMGMVAELMKKLDDEAEQEDGRGPVAPEDEPDRGHASGAGTSNPDARQEGQSGNRRPGEAAAAEEGRL